MNNDLGRGSGAPYEYIIAEKKTPARTAKKVTFILLYVLWAAGWLFLAFRIKWIVPFLALIPISLWIIVFLTWRYTEIEYEYSFFSGTLTVHKILGGKSRKRMLELDLRRLDAVFPNDQSGKARVEGMLVDELYTAISHPDSDAVYAAIWQEGGKSCLLWFEPDEKARKLIRYYQPRAIDREQISH
ncbi:MAG: hypothetical protein IKC31_08020 [Clostridia bacterium]|nr:hypothetical protein [Clostridia bacterium]